MRVVGIIQARMGSTRLPGKVLKMLSGKPMIWHIIERLKLASKLDALVVATSDLPKDAVLIDIARECGIQGFAGSELDVLDRFVKAAEVYDADIVVRLFGDGPLMEPKVVDQVVQRLVKTGADHAWALVDETHPKSFPRGLSTEAVRVETLQRVQSLTDDPYDHEHVTVFIFEHPCLFHIETVEAKGKLCRPDLRLTVDTEEDFRLIEEIYRRLYKPSRIVDLAEAIDLLDSYPEIAAINYGTQQKDSASLFGGRRGAPTDNAS